MSSTHTNKGAIIKILGVVLIILGFLDSMLALRGGLSFSGFYVFLLGGGALLYAVGAVRQGRALR